MTIQCSYELRDRNAQKTLKVQIGTLTQPGGVWDTEVFLKEVTILLTLEELVQVN